MIIGYGRRGVIIAMAIIALAAAAYGDPILVFNTGVDSAGNPLPDGTIADPHYILYSAPSGSTTATRVRRSAGGFPIPPYAGDDTLSAWIGPDNATDLNGPVGSYDYRTTFDLTGLNPGTASLTIGWSTDNNGLDVLLNGNSLGQTTGTEQFRYGFSTFTVTSGFVSGVNTLDFIVYNMAGPSDNPTALRTEISGTAAPVPEPSSVLLTGSFIVAVAILGWRRRRPARA